MLLALVALAGCASPADLSPPAFHAAGDPAAHSSPATDGPTSARPPLVSEDSCGIAGFVGDDELLPISHALVRLSARTPRPTAPDGRFSFDLVQLGTYELEVAAEGYESQARTVECRGGEVMDQLVFALHPRTGYVPGAKLLLFKGRIGCSPFLFDSEGNPGPRGDWCGGVDSQARTRFAFRLDPGELTGAAYEASWKRAGLLGTDFLKIRYPYMDSGFQAGREPSHLSATLCPTTSTMGDGSSGLVGRSVLCAQFQRDDGRPLQVWGSPDDHVRISDRPTGHLEVQAYGGSRHSPNLAHPQEHVGLVVEQDFEVAVTYFYNGLPIPDDYAYFER